MQYLCKLSQLQRQLSERHKTIDTIYDGPALQAPLPTGSSEEAVSLAYWRQWASYERINPSLLAAVSKLWKN